MKTQLYFVRHGQSEGNLKRRFLGHTDLDLSPLGCKQAECLAHYLENIPFDGIYSSDLLRAAHTIAEIARNRGQEVTYDVGLREIYAGEWENQPFTYLEEHFPTEYRTFRKNIGVACPNGGESTHHVGKRVFAAIERIVAENQGKTLLISTHATAICMFACEVLGLPDEERYRLSLPTNASLSIFTWEDGRFTLKSYSQDAYLGQWCTPTPPLA